MELINWIWFAGAIASAATLGIADGKARNIQPIEALWLALLWVTAARKSDLPVVAGDQWQSFDVSVVPTRSFNGHFRRSPGYVVQLLVQTLVCACHVARRTVRLAIVELPKQ